MVLKWIQNGPKVIPKWCQMVPNVPAKSTTAVFPRRSKKRKSNNDDKHDHGQEKRRPSTLCWGKDIYVGINKDYVYIYIYKYIYIDMLHKEYYDWYATSCNLKTKNQFRNTNLNNDNSKKAKTKKINQKRKHPKKGTSGK